MHNILAVYGNICIIQKNAICFYKTEFALISITMYQIRNPYYKMMHLERISHFDRAGVPPPPHVTV